MFSASESAWSLWCLPGKAEGIYLWSSLAVLLILMFINLDWVSCPLTHSVLCAQWSLLWTEPETPRNGLSSEALGPRNWEKHSTCKVLYLMALKIVPLFLLKASNLLTFQAHCKRHLCERVLQRRQRHAFQLTMEVDSWLTELLTFNLMVFLHKLLWQVHRALGTYLDYFNFK